MKINIFKIFFFLNFLNITFGKIEDPVARHDLSECSTYLCPKYRIMAEDYMRGGCVGEFKDYILKGSLKENIELNMISKNDIKMVNLNILLFLSTISALTSFYIGFLIGKKEELFNKTNRLKINEMR